MNVKLAKLFVEKGYLSLDNLKTAVEQQKLTNKSLGEILITQGYITETQLVEITNLENLFPSIDLSNVDIPEEVIKSVPKDTALENNLIPFGLDDTYLKVAMIDPTNLVLIDELRFLTGHNIKPYISEFSNINAAISKYYNVPLQDIVHKTEPVQQQQEEQPVQHQEPQGVADQPQSPEQQEVLSTEQPEQPSAGTDSFSAPQPPVQQQPSKYQFESTNQSGFESSAAQNEQPAQQFTAPPAPPVIETPNFEEVKSTQNEITDVFARDDDGVSNREKIPQSGFDNRSQQSSDSMFAAPAQPSSDSSIQTTDNQQDLSQQSEQAIFQAPSQQEQPVGFQPLQSTESTDSMQYEHTGTDGEQPVEQNNVFVSSNTAESSEQTVEDRTIELSIEAEEIEDEQIAHSEEAKDVFGIQAQESVQPVQNSTDAQPGSADNVADTTQSAEPSLDSSEIDKLFNIPGQDSASGYSEQSSNTESESRSLKEDASYENIENFNTSIDNNGSQSGVANTDAQQSYQTEFGSVGPAAQSDSLGEKQKPAQQESVYPIREEVAPEGKSVVKPTVLVVDDSQTVQKIVSVTLSRQGYRVEVSSNAMQALAKLNDVIPDIIFLDINLPHMDGYQLCKIIKGNELTKEIPVVMLSGKDGFFDKMRGKMVGAADYITKPFEPNALVSAIKKQGIDTSSGVM